MIRINKEALRVSQAFNNKEQELKKIEDVSEIKQWDLELDEFIKAYNLWTKIHSNLDNKPSKITK